MENIVEYSCQASTSAWPDQVEIYTSDVPPKQLGVLLSAEESTHGGRGLIVNSILPTREQVTLRLRGWGPKDGNCCPSRRLVQEFRWSGDSFTKGPMKQVLLKPHTEVNRFLRAWWSGDDGAAQRHLLTLDVSELTLPRAGGDTFTEYEPLDARSCEPSGRDVFRCFVWFSTESSALGYYAIVIVLDEYERDFALLEFQSIGDPG